MKKGSIKNTRINSEVRKEIQNIVMNGLKDPRVSPMTTITDARVTADLRYCTVYVSVLGGEQAVKDTMDGLERASGFIRRELAHTVNLRITPELRFVADSSLAYGDHIDRMLKDLREANGMGTDEEAEEGSAAGDADEGEADGADEEEADDADDADAEEADGSVTEEQDR